MITDYKSRKNEVLESSKTVEQLVKELESNARRAKMPSPLEPLEPLLAEIRKKSEKVRADKFTLMIAGEAKSGKSTFINAYLGVELLPMDVKQCTSAIIEIKYGKEFYVLATYADGQEKKIVGDSAARDFLKKNAALDDDYRDIPVPTINSEILVKSGLRAKEKGKKITVLEAEVEDLLAAPEVQEANIHNISKDKYNKKIRDYINKKKGTWENIVTKIEVFYPFSEELRGIEIIDSPGVYASGGVAEVTSKYIESADAIIFLKPVSGQALESTQFNQFMQNSSVARNKNALFLVLTRATNVTPEELRRLETEAYKQFSNLDKENILLIDSKAELYAKKFSAFETKNVEDELRELNKTGTLDDFVAKAYTETSGFLSDGEGDFIKKLEEISRFEGVYNSLEAFGRKAHYILLGQLLDSISKLYEKVWNDLNFQMDMFRQKAEDPNELAKKIAVVKCELEQIRHKLYSGIAVVTRSFTGDEGIIITEANKAVKDFEAQVSGIRDDSTDAFSELERHAKKKIEEFQELTKSLQKNVVSKCDKELAALSVDSVIPFESLKPNFTENTFDEIRDSTQSKSNNTHSYEEGLTFKTTQSRSVYSKKKHYRLIKDSIISRIGDIKKGLVDNLNDFMEKIGEIYIEELSKSADTKQTELDAIMEAKVTAEQTKKIISELVTLIQRISSAKSDAVKIKGGISKYVQ